MYPNNPTFTFVQPLPAPVPIHVEFQSAPPLPPAARAFDRPALVDPFILNPKNFTGERPQPTGILFPQPLGSSITATPPPAPVEEPEPIRPVPKRPEPAPLEDVKPVIQPRPVTDLPPQPPVRKYKLPLSTRHNPDFTAPTSTPPRPKRGNHSNRWKREDDFLLEISVLQLGKDWEAIKREKFADNPKRTPEELRKRWLDLQALHNGETPAIKKRVRRRKPEGSDESSKWGTSCIYHRHHHRACEGPTCPQHLACAVHIGLRELCPEDCPFAHPEDSKPVDGRPCPNVLGFEALKSGEYAIKR